MPDDFGPWHDFEAAAAQMDRAQQLNAARLGQDIVAQLDRRPSSEDRVARALDRIADGTYHEPSQPDVLGRYDGLCGAPTDNGTCSARFHDADCEAVIAGAAATGDAEAAEAWRAVLADYVPPPEALGLASPLDDGGDWRADAVLAPLGGSDQALREAVLAMLGGEGRAEQPRPVLPGREPLPDVSGLRTSLGL